MIDQLLDKGLVSVSQSAPKRFAAISLEDAITKLMGRIEKDAQYARDSLSGIYQERMNPGTLEPRNSSGISMVSKISKNDSLISFPVQNGRSKLLPTPSFYHTILNRNYHCKGKSNQRRNYHPPLGRRDCPKKMRVYVIKHPEIPKRV